MSASPSHALPPHRSHPLPLITPQVPSRSASSQAADITSNGRPTFAGRRRKCVPPRDLSAHVTRDARRLCSDHVSPRTRCLLYRGEIWPISVRSLTPFRPGLVACSVHVYYHPCLALARGGIPSNCIPHFLFAFMSPEASRYTLTNLQPYRSVGTMSVHHGLHRHASSCSSGSRSALSHPTHRDTHSRAINNSQLTTSFYSIVRPRFRERNFISISLSLLSHADPLVREVGPSFSSFDRKMSFN